MHNSNITTKSSSSSLQNININLHQLIENPIPQSDYPQLQLIIKCLSEYMQKCVKNRQYIEAQKAKDKIQQAHACIKRRNSNHIVDRMVTNPQIKRLEAKQEQQRLVFMDEWDMRIGLMEEKFNEGIEKKRRANQQQIMRLREQVQLALPMTHSPDDKLKQLRHQQKRVANAGNFIEAQKIKDEIESREIYLEQKHRKLRQSNIKAMLEQLNQKHEKDLKQRQKQKKVALDEVVKQKNKRQKQMEDRHQKQMRQLKWMHNEEMRLVN